MPDYERGSAAWDIGMVLTRHANGMTKSERGNYAVCARVLDLRQTAHARSLNGPERLTSCLAVPCTCGAGDSDSETSSLAITKEGRDAQKASATVASGDRTGLPESAS